MDPNEEQAPRLPGIPDMVMFEAFRGLAELMGAMSKSGGDIPRTERSGPRLCMPYMISGRCKSGASCNLLHPGREGGSSVLTALNIHGYPLRPGEKICSDYVETGQCKFGATCKFHHPLLAGAQVAAPVPGPAPVRPAASASTGLYDPVSSLFPASSGSSPMSGMFADLPQEVFFDILLRLPLKSIGRSRCVSKPWLSLLSNYEFIKAHLARHIAQEQKLLLLSSNHSLFSLTPHLGGNDLRELKFSDEQVNSLVGSCNGLILVGSKGRRMGLINCITQEYDKLPSSPFGLCPHLCFKKYGFGYDVLADDYKIVKMSQCDYGQSDEPNCPDIYIDIYSLRARSWNRLGAPLYGHDLLSHDDCVFLNGAFHYIGMKYKFSDKQSAIIGAFNLSSETFTEIPVPASVNESYKILSAKLMVIDGCLGMVIRPYGARKTEIWLLKSYPVVESWTKLVLDIEPLCCHEGKILFKDERDEVLKWHSVRGGTVDVCLVKDGGVRFDVGMACSESLVSPHFNYQ